MSGRLARRRVEPELLDHLPVDDPEAIGSRRDLARVNAVMFQPRIMAHLFRRHVRTGQLRLLEIGAGDGTFMLKVARHLGERWHGTELLLLDQADLVSDRTRNGFATLDWQVETVTTDLFPWIENPHIGTFDAVSTNLFLHHFSDGDLRRLFTRLAEFTPVFLASEPRRNAVALAGTSLLRILGANRVTLHDAAASVRAGFRGRELAALWPDNLYDRLGEWAFGPFTHAFTVTPVGKKR